MILCLRLFVFITLKSWINIILKNLICSNHLSKILTKLVLIKHTQWRLIYQSADMEINVKTFISKNRLSEITLFIILLEITNVIDIYI